jgi:hypothetical protein
MPTEVIPKGQEETHLSFDVVAPRNGDEPFLVMTVHGPDAPVCLTFRRRTVRELIETFKGYHKELRREFSTIA